MNTRESARFVLHHLYGSGAFVFDTGRIWRRTRTTYLYTEFAQR